MIISVLLNSTSLQCAVISTDPECYVMTLTLTIHICKDQARTSVIICQTHCFFSVKLTSLLITNSYIILQALPLFVHHYEKASDNFKSNLQTIRFLDHPCSPSKSEVAGPMLICISPGKQDYNLALQYLKMCMPTIWYNTLISEI